MALSRQEYTVLPPFPQSLAVRLKIGGRIGQAHRVFLPPHAANPVFYANRMSQKQGSVCNTPWYSAIVVRRCVTERAPPPGRDGQSGPVGYGFVALWFVRTHSQSDPQPLAQSARSQRPSPDREVDKLYS